MKRIVFIHGGAIGDLVQTLPAMAAVRAAWPEATVTLIGRPERAALAVVAGAAERIVDVETCGLWRVLGEAEAPTLPVLDGADLVVDLFTKGALAAALGRDNRRVVSIDPLPPEGWDRSAAAWILDQVRGALGLAVSSETPCIPLTEAAAGAARALLASRGVGKRFVALHPGSGSPAKNWPADRFARLARRVRDESERNVVWLAGPAEQERGTLPRAADDDTVLADLTLVQVAGVLAVADGYVGNDSGITQIAAAVRGPDGQPPQSPSAGLPASKACAGPRDGMLSQAKAWHPSRGRATPTVALFGPTDPRVWSPRGKHVRVIAAAGGQIERISVDEVAEAVAALLIR